MGGAVRDAALGREVMDVDLAVAGDEREAARRSAGGRGPVFQLSEEFATWRALAADGAWHVDVTRLRGDGIEADLALRDFTVNAIAVPLAEPAAPPLDPHGGLADVDGRVLRAVSERSFADDPLRILRAARIAAALALEIDRTTVDLARAEAERAGEPAGERQFAELRLLLTGADPVEGCGSSTSWRRRGRAARARGAPRRRAEPLPPPRRSRPHDRRCWRGCSRWRPISEGFVGPAAEGFASCSPSRSPTSSPGAARFASPPSFHDLGKPETRARGRGRPGAVHRPRSRRRAASCASSARACGPAGAWPTTWPT